MDPLGKNIKHISKIMGDHARRLRRLETRSHPTTANNDTVPPTAPTNFAGAAISYHQIQLTWTAATDDKGVAGYTIYRGGVKIGSTTSLSYNDYAVSGGTAYSYTIDAYDFGKNYSPKTNPLVIATPAQPDTTPPTVPDNLHYTAVDSNSVSLAWNASTDNIGVVGYILYRDGVQVAQPAITSYLDSTLSPSTGYSYQVAAYDAAGNISARSTALNITTSTTPTPALGTYYASLSGSASNDGSISAPWTLSYALNGAGGGSIVAGNTLYIRAGTYDITATQVVTGFAGNISLHIKVLPYPGERVILRNIATTAFNTLEVRNVTYTDFIDLELTAYNYTRSSEAGAEVAMAHVYENPSYTQSHMRWLDCKLHDAPGKAYKFAATSDYSELNGCALFFNGSSSTYDPTILGVSDSTKNKIIRDCVILDNASDGIKLYTGDTTAVRNFNLAGNAVINSGVLYNKAQRDILVAGVSVAPRDITITANNIYNYMSVGGTGRSLQVGHVGATGGGGTGAPLTLKSPNITGTIYYVANGGSDSNPGTLAAPFATINKGLSVVSPGGAVYVRGGNYNITHTWTHTHNIGSANPASDSQRIHLMAYPGETPVIDGTNIAAPSHYEWLVRANGDYMYISGFHITKANGAAFWVYGNYNIVDNFYVDYAMQNGIFVGGDHCWVQNSTAYRCCWDNHLGGAWNGYWASGITAARGHYGSPTTITTDTTFVNCTCVEAWGEGFSAFESSQTKFYDCVGHDNFSANYYISDSDYVDVQRCMSWHDPAASDMWNSSGAKAGFMFGCEEHYPVMAHMKMLNCIGYNSWRNFVWWYGVLSPNMNDYYIANNTFLNSQVVGSGWGAFSIGQTYGGIDHVNSYVVNNIIEQDDSYKIEHIGHPGGLIIDHNLWSNTTAADAPGTNAIVADPLLTKSGSPHDPNYYKLQAGSPAIDSGMAATGVTVDYFRINRSGTVDRGACEYSTGSASDAGAVNIAGTGNILVGQSVDLSGSGYNNVTFSSNSMYYAQASIGNTEALYPNNLWSKTFPATAPIVRVRVYDYDHKKALILAYNWTGATAITITAADLAGLDLPVGTGYLLRNYENYYADTISGTYNGVSIALPLTLRTHAAPVGGVATPATSLPNCTVWQISAVGGEVLPVPVVGSVMGLLAGITYGDGSAGADTTPPSTPGSVTSTWVSATAQDIAWSASTDNVGVTGYTIYRNGTQYDTTASTTYHDTALTKGEFYDYQVDAYDAAGNHSSLSSHVYGGLWIATDGSSANSGSYASPWTLAYVLNGAAGGTIPAGATIFIKAGTYTLSTSQAVSTLSGTAGNPVFIKAQPGARVTLHANMTSQFVALSFGNVSYLQFYDLEIDAYGYTRTTNQGAVSSAYLIRFDPAYNQAGIKFFGCILHDCLGPGVYSWTNTRGIEFNGCHVYYNGQSSGYDYGMWVANTDTYTFALKNSILHNNAANNFAAYSDGSDAISSITILGCVVFNPGSLYSLTASTNTTTIGSWLTSDNDITFSSNRYYTPDSSSSYNFRLSRPANGYNVTNSSIMLNYLVGKKIDMASTGWTGNTVTYNTIYCTGTLDATTQARLDAGTGNTVAAIPGSGTYVSVRVMDWDSKRGVVALYNYAGASTMTIYDLDLTSAGVSISNGDSYALHNAENYYGDVITGTYNGTSITVGMSGRTQAAPVGGISTPATAFPYFGSFVLIVS